MKWLLLWLLLSTPSVFAEDFGCFGGWSECDVGCWMPMQTVTPAENTRVVVKAPAGSRLDLWGTPQPVLKSEVGSYKFYLNPCLVSATKEITVSIPVDGRIETLTDKVDIYPGQENVFGYYWDDYSQHLLRFQNHNSRLFLLMKVPDGSIIYVNGVKRRNNEGPLRLFYTKEPDGTLFDKSVITVTLKMEDGTVLKWEETFDFKVQLDPYRMTLVVLDGELIRREPLRKKQAAPTPVTPRVVKPRSRT